MDLQPILVLDFGKLKYLLDRKEIDAQLFCSLHNFYARYIINNMLIPGQVEKWITIANINQFPIKDLPIKLFKESARELSCNYIDMASR